MEGTVRCHGWPGYREVCHPWLLGFSVLQGENSSPKPDRLWLPSTMDTPEVNVTYLEKVTEICFTIWGVMTKNKTLKRTCVLRNHFILCQKHSVPACLSLAGFPGWLSWHLHGSAAHTLHLPPFLCVLQTQALTLLSGWGHCLTLSFSPSISSLLENTVLPERPGPTAAHACGTNRKNMAVTYEDKYQSK